ncbi:Integrase catalytic domain-containing protein [Citrus sinensis]|uniref:Integrase catalytic domain-containing protein n=1 Tax=Citrus sinensis TaxID=2711 RepID=A0ACB8IKX9_CITSI|nr:Integrase catalytic domain-containing protein [Citrus sinensis]
MSSVGVQDLVYDPSSGFSVLCFILGDSFWLLLCSISTGGVESIKIGDKDKAFFLLSSLPKSYEGFVDTMLYGRTTLTLEDVKASLCSKEIQRHSGDLDQNPSEGDCVEKKRDNKEKSGDAAVTSNESSDGGYQSADLPVASNGKIESQWVLDSSCSFHMSPDKTLFHEYETIDGDKAKLWHLRLGHMSAKGLQELSKRGLLCRDKVEELKFCENCIFGKAHRMKFERGMHKSKAVLDYAHSNLWGLAQVPSLSDQAFEKFKIWRALVENQSEMKLKELRNDNGLKFYNKEFDEYCQKHGLAERMNRPLIDKTRCPLINSKLPRSFWAEAVTTVCYLVNRSPSAALKFETPEEVWTGVPADYKHLRLSVCYLVNRSPSAALKFETPEEVWTGVPADYKHLRIFGFIAYLHVKQGKLDSRALKGVFVGYPEGVKGYKVWCGATHKCIISRDVTFHEEAMLEDKDSIVFDFNPYTDESMKEATVVKDSIIEVESTNSSDRGDQYVGATDDFQERSEVTDSRTSVFELHDYQLARDRARKETKPPSRYAYVGMVAYALNSVEDITIEEPASYREAVKSSDPRNWIKAMEEEIDSLIKKKTWTLVTNLGNESLVSCKWIFKRKEGIPGAEASRFKARLVARGFTQKEGVDFTEVFSPVVKHSSIRMLLSMVALTDMEIDQMDVKTTFLHGKLEVEILMTQPEGFEVKEEEDYVCHLNKSLYGLKESPRQWYKRFDEFMISNGYLRSKYVSCVYFGSSSSGGAVYLMLYVDGMLLASKDMSEIKKLKDLLNAEFEMKDLGCAKTILGMDIIRDRAVGTLFVSQERYILKVLDRFDILDAKSVQTPLGSQFKLSKVQAPVTNQDKFMMSEVPYAQAVGSLMYAMAEFVAATEAVKEGKWLCGILNELWLRQKIFTIFCDNQSAIHLIKNQVYHERTKHIDVRLHFIRDEVSKGVVSVSKIHTDVNPANVLTKVVPTAKFNFFVNLMGVVEKSQ